MCRLHLLSRSLSSSMPMKNCSRMWTDCARIEMNMIYSCIWKWYDPKQHGLFLAWEVLKFLVTLQVLWTSHSNDNLLKIQKLPYTLEADGAVPGHTPFLTYFTLFRNQISSSPLSAAKRLQFALEVEPVEKFDLMSKLPRAIIPLMWVEESAHLNKTYTALFKQLYT